MYQAHIDPDPPAHALDSEAFLEIIFKRPNLLPKLIEPCNKLFELAVVIHHHRNHDEQQYEDRPVRSHRPKGCGGAEDHEHENVGLTDSAWRFAVDLKES